MGGTHSDIMQGDFSQQIQSRPYEEPKGIFQDLREFVYNKGGVIEKGKIILPTGEIFIPKRKARAMTDNLGKEDPSKKPEPYKRQDAAPFLEGRVNVTLFPIDPEQVDLYGVPRSGTYGWSNGPDSLKHQVFYKGRRYDCHLDGTSKVPVILMDDGTVVRVEWNDLVKMAASLHPDENPDVPQPEAHAGILDPEIAHLEAEVQKWRVILCDLVMMQDRVLKPKTIELSLAKEQLGGFQAKLKRAREMYEDLRPHRSGATSPC